MLYLPDKPYMKGSGKSYMRITCSNPIKNKISTINMVYTPFVIVTALADHELSERELKLMQNLRQ
jgi:hypothetical protein